MFKIYDGREHFFQWDLNQKLIVEDNTINQVHFTNGSDNCCLVVDVREEDGLRVAYIPNILLQKDWKLRAFAYATDYTKREEVYKVMPKRKPTDYAYTETEVHTWDALNERLNEIEGGSVSVDLTDYYTKSETEEEIGEAIAAVNERIDTLEENAGTGSTVDLSNYYTKSEADTKIGEAIAAVDLSGYALKSEIPNTTGFVNEAQVIALINEYASGEALPAAEEVAF